MSHSSGKLTIRGSLAEDDNLLPINHHLDEQLGIEVVLMSGKIDRPTTDPLYKGAGHPMYLGISEELQHKLGIKALGEHVALVPIEDDTRFGIYLISALIDDETFLKRAAKGSYTMSGIHSETQASEITVSNPLSKNSISLPDGKLGKTVQYFVLDAKKSHGKLPTLLPTRCYLDYPVGLRKKWERENLSGLPILVLPNGVARLLGISTAENTNLPKNIGKTVVGGAVCTVRYQEGKALEVFVVGARDALGCTPELLTELGLDLQKECRLQVNTGNRELIIESNKTADTREGVHDSIVETIK